VPDDATKSTSLSASLSDHSSSERRGAARHPFIASAEETDLASGTRLSARVSELSLKGCYLDTLNPFPKGTQIRLVIFHGGATFTVPATVVYPQPNMGMGVVFSAVEPEQLEVLTKWLAELSGK
jgi:PilZ domain